MQNRKLFCYNILLFFLLLTVEVLVIVATKIGKFRDGKVFSSLDGQFQNIIASSGFSLARYCFTLLALYLLAAWINYRISLKFSKLFNFPKDENQRLVFYFMVVNSIFIALIYLFNGYFYPHSLHSSLLGQSSLPVSPEKFVIIFYLFVLLYFSALCLSLKDSPAILILAATISVSILGINHLPGLLARSIPLDHDSTDQGTNVIIIGIDSLRPDHLSYFNKLAPSTPTVEDFFNNSIVFTNAYTPLARTYPAWVSILSGTYPARNGARYNLVKDNYLKENVFTLNKILRDQYGYATIHGMDETRFCNISREDGFDELIHPVTGVSDFLLGNHHDFPIANLFLNNRTGALFFPFLNRNRAISHLYTGNTFTDDILLSISNRQQTGPFFLAVHLCYPHWPYQSARPLGTEEPNQTDGGYRHSIQQADEQLELLLTGLKKRNLFDKSIIIVLSDHGESFGPEHWGHGTSLHDVSQNHIALAVKPPHFRAHAEIDDLVSTVDIAPTILDLLKISRQPGQMDGKPLLNRDDPPDPDRTIFMETGFHLFHSFGKAFSLDEMIKTGAEYYEVSPEDGLITVRRKFHDQIIATKQLGAQRLNWRLIVQQDENEDWLAELFDLHSDPLMTKDLSSEQPELMFTLLEELDTHYNLPRSFTEMTDNRKAQLLKSSEL